MELKMNPQVRSPRAAGRPSPVREQKQEAGSASPRQGQAQEDKVELSPEALEHMRNQQESGRQTEPLSPEEKRQQAQAEKLKAAKQMLDVMRQQSAQMKEQSQKQADALKKSLDKMKKCARISRNIGKGHKVPLEDEQYLLENDPNAYMMALMLRMMAEDKDKVKSELDDEDLQREQSGAESAGGPEATAEVGSGEISVDSAGSAE